jgi:sec-independent protein translocase protein TatC
VTLPENYAKDLKVTPKKTATKPPASPTKSQTSSVTKSFEGHLRELYNRFAVVAIIFVLACIVGYVFREQLQTFLLQPLNNQALVYTSPAGGLNFVIKICLLFGFLVSLPLLIYQVLAYIKPAHEVINQRLVITTFIASSLLAFCGVVFAYFIILPASLNFLEQFASDSIQSLITTDEYISFVLLYVCGLAAIFQLPLIMTLVGKIGGITAGKLLRLSGYMILVSFIFGAIITPTPDPINQGLIAGPTILLYFVGVTCVYLVNRSSTKLS